MFEVFFHEPIKLYKRLGQRAGHPEYAVEGIPFTGRMREVSERDLSRRRDLGGRSAELRDAVLIFAPPIDAEAGDAVECAEIRYILSSVQTLRDLSGRTEHLEMTAYRDGEA